MLAIARWVAALVVTVGAMHVRPASASADGYFDATWAGGGRIVFAGDPAHQSYPAYVGSGLIEGNGNLLFGGLLLSSPYVSWWLGELTPDGNFNSSFGIDTGQPYFYPGRVNGCQIGLSCAGSSYGFNAFARQADNKILVLSAQHLARTNDVANALDIAGVSGGTGSVAPVFPLDTSTGYVSANTIHLQGDGKVLVAGDGRSGPSDTAPKFGLVRLNADLSIDKTFNSVGQNPSSWGVLLRVDATDSDESAASVLQQPDGRIVIVGLGTRTGQSYLDVVRLDAGGAPDPQFGTSGIAKIPFDVSISSGLSATLDLSGRIVVSLPRGDSAGVIVARVTSGGQLDGTFGSAGLFTLSAATLGCTSAGACALAIDSAGRIVAGGSCDSQFLVERIRGDNGTLDASFGFEGVSHGIFSPSSTSDDVCSVTFDRGGRLFVAGSSTISAVAQAGVARLTYDLVYTNNFDAAPRGCLPPDCT